MPTYKDTMQLIGNLCSLQTDEHGVQFNFRTVGNENTLLDIWLNFTEWVDAYHNYSVFLGLGIDAKEI